MKYAIKTLKILSKPFSLNHLIKIEYCVARDSALKYSKIFDLALWPKYLDQLDQKLILLHVKAIFSIKLPYY